MDISNKYIIVNTEIEGVKSQLILFYYKCLWRSGDDTVLNLKNTKTVIFISEERILTFGSLNYLKNTFISMEQIPLEELFNL